MHFNIIISCFLCFSFPCLAFFSIPDMTLEEKIGQLLIVHFQGEKANKDALTLIQKVHIGGFIYYNWANGLTSPKQVMRLSFELQKLSKQNRIPIPLFITIDQEGGLVSRLTKGFTIFPGNKALGMTNDPTLSEQCAFAIGQELYAVGVNFNLSPVVDVNTNLQNPVIGIRAFGNTPEIVIPFAKSAIKGYHRAGIIISLKHFPGLGDVEVDAHQELPLIKKSKLELQTTELLPFIELISDADSVMTTHVMVPTIDPINCATISKKILDVLRNEIGFDGVIISDSLMMEGLLKNCSSVDEAAILAINAGCDVLILGGKQLIGSHANLELSVHDVKRIHKTLVDAVKNGVILEKRIDDAVQRVLNLKRKYQILTTKKKSNLLGVINNKEHNLLAKKIASQAVKISKKNVLFHPSLRKQKIAIFAPKIVRDSIQQTSLLKLGRKNYCLFFEELNPNSKEIKTANEIIENTDLLIFCSYKASENSQQEMLVQALIKNKKPTIILSLGDPLDAVIFQSADIILSTFSPTAPSIQAACDILVKILK